MILQKRGFTLVELMIVVAIVGILSMVAYPSYQNHLTKSRRADCKSMLMSFANAMERQYTVGYSYMDAGTDDEDGIGAGDSGTPTIFASQCPNDGTRKYYDLTIKDDISKDAYTLVATPIAGSPQATDGMLELTSTEVRRWDQNNDGDFADANETSW